MAKRTYKRDSKGRFAKVNAARKAKSAARVQHRKTSLSATNRYIKQNIIVSASGFVGSEASRAAIRKAAVSHAGQRAQRYVASKGINPMIAGSLLETGAVRLGQAGARKASFQYTKRAGYDVNPQFLPKGKDKKRVQRIMAAEAAWAVHGDKVKSAVAFARTPYGRAVIKSLTGH